MNAAWLDEVAHFADLLDHSQQALLAVLRQRRRALAAGNTLEIERCNEAGRQAAHQLQVLSAWRQRLLDDAVRLGASGGTLVDVLGERITVDAERLRGRLQQLQQRFDEVRREAWTEWVITHRVTSYYAEVLDLIAHGGRLPLVYGDDRLSSSGGVVLDAAA